MIELTQAVRVRATPVRDDDDLVARTVDALHVEVPFAPMNSSSLQALMAARSVNSLTGAGASAGTGPPLR